MLKRLGAEFLGTGMMVSLGCLSIKLEWSSLWISFTFGAAVFIAILLLRNTGVRYESERIVPVPFEGHVIGNLRADIIVDSQIVLESKAIKTLNDQAELQALNYLRLLDLKIAYLINFPPFPNREVEIRKVVT